MPSPAVLTRTAVVMGDDAFVIDVEAPIVDGVPGLHLIGLPDDTVLQTRDRVRAAMINSDLPWAHRHALARLRPLSLPKHGTAYDLAIACALLAAQHQIPQAACVDVVFVAELGLDGTLRPVPGVPTAGLAAANAGYTRLLVASANAAEATTIPGITSIGADTLTEAVTWLCGSPLPPPAPAESRPPATPIPSGPRPDLAEVKITSEQVVGEHAIAGRRVLVQRITWSGTSRLSFDLLDADTYQYLTEESFDDYPTHEQIKEVLGELGNAGEGSTACEEIVLTDAHWRAITDLHDYDGYTIDEFSDIEGVLVDAQSVLGHRSDDALALPRLLEISCWDTSDTDNNDLMLTVDPPEAPRLATEPFRIESVGSDAPAPTGSARARAVLADLVSYRNRLMRELDGFGRHVTDRSRRSGAEAVAATGSAGEDA